MSEKLPRIVVEVSYKFFAEVDTCLVAINQRRMIPFTRSDWIRELLVAALLKESQMETDHGATAKSPGET